MRVIDHLTRNDGRTAFSFEILPPLKGNNISRVYGIIDRLLEFDPKYINITSHRSTVEYQERPDGTIVKKKIRKRPGSVAIASASMASRLFPISYARDSLATRPNMPSSTSTF